MMKSKSVSNSSNGDSLSYYSSVTSSLIPTITTTTTSTTTTTLSTSLPVSPSPSSSSSPKAGSPKTSSVPSNINKVNINQAFPLKLFHILENEDTDIIRWHTNNIAFRIVDSDRFEKEIIPKYFRHNQLSSVQRQLNLYGFKCISRGDDKGAFFHPKFRRNNIELVKSITRYIPSKNSGNESIYDMLVRENVNGQTPDLTTIENLMVKSENNADLMNFYNNYSNNNKPIISSNKFSDEKQNDQNELIKTNNTSNSSTTNITSTSTSKISAHNTKTSNALYNSFTQQSSFSQTIPPTQSIIPYQFPSSGTDQMIKNPPGIRGYNEPNHPSATSASIVSSSNSNTTLQNSSSNTSNTINNSNNTNSTPNFTDGYHFDHHYHYHHLHPSASFNPFKPPSFPTFPQQYFPYSYNIPSQYTYSYPSTFYPNTNTYPNNNNTYPNNNNTYPPTSSSSSTSSSDINSTNQSGSNSSPIPASMSNDMESFFDFLIEPKEEYPSTKVLREDKGCNTEISQAMYDLDGLFSNLTRKYH